MLLGWLIVPALGIVATGVDKRPRPVVHGRKGAGCSVATLQHEPVSATAKVCRDERKGDSLVLIVDDRFVDAAAVIP